ncbi:MAG: cytochrome c oxidase subunit 3 [Myxococcota bacterium]
MYEKSLVTFSGVPARRQIVSNAVMGMLIFVMVEAMLFAGMISAFMIVKTSALGAWPPPGQPRLPVEETAINTAALLISGYVLFVAHRAFRREAERARLPLLGAILLGAFFVIFQGVEWVALVREGLTVTSSTHGSFFYLIVGMHALHAVAALVVLAYVWGLLRSGRLAPSTFHSGQIFWYFVVGLWPILYFQVYL